MSAGGTERVAIEIVSEAVLAGIQQSIAALRELGLAIGQVGTATAEADSGAAAGATAVERLGTAAAAADAPLTAIGASLLEAGVAAEEAAPPANLLAEALERIAAIAGVTGGDLGALAAAAAEAGAGASAAGSEAATAAEMLARLGEVIALDEADLAAFAAASTQADAALAALGAAGAEVDAALTATGATADKAAAAFAEMGAMAAENAAAAAAAGEGAVALSAAQDAAAASADALAGSQVAAAAAGTEAAAAQGEVAASAVAATAATEALAGATEAASAATAAHAATQQQVAAAAGQAEAAFSRSTTSLGGLQNALLLVAGGAAALFASFASDAGQFDMTMQKITFLADAGGMSIQQLSEHTRELAAQMGQSPKAMGDALYFIASAGFKASEADDMLKASSAAATLAMADQAKIADALTTVMASYAIPASQAWQVTDKLVQIVKQGKAEFEDIATNIGHVTAIAHQSGISLDEVGAAMAVMTQRGDSAAEAADGLKSLLVALEAPTARAKKAFADLGISMDDLQSTLHNQGLLNTFLMLADAVSKTGQSSDATLEELRPIIPNIRALNAALIAVSSDGGAQFNQILASMGDNAGSTATAYAQFQQTTAGANAKLKADFENLKITLGETVQKTMTDLSKQLDGVVLGLGRFGAAHGQAVERTLQLVGALGLVVGAIKAAQFAYQGYVLLQGAALAVAGGFQAVYLGLASAITGESAATLLSSGALGVNAAARQVLARETALQAAAELEATAATLQEAGASEFLTSALLEQAAAKRAAADSATGLSGGMTAAFGAGTVLLPVLVAVGLAAAGSAIEMQDMAKGARDAAQAIGGDLGGALAKVQVNAGEGFIAFLTGSAIGADKAAKATHDWAAGLDGATPTLEQMQGELNKAADAYARLQAAGMGNSAQATTIKAVAQAIFDEMNARRLDSEWINTQIGAGDRWFASVQRDNAEVQGFTGAMQGLVTGFGAAAAATTLHEGALNAALVATDQARNADENYAGALRTLGDVAQRAQDQFAALLKEQQDAATQASTYSGQAKLLEDGMDRLNARYAVGLTLNAAQVGSYQQAATAAAFYNEAVGELNQSQFDSAIAAQQEVEARIDAVRQAALMVGATTATSDALRDEAAAFLASAAAILQEESALRASKQAHSELGSQINELTARKKELDDQVKAGVPLTDQQKNQLKEINDLLPGLNTQYKQQTDNLTDQQLALIKSQQAQQAATAAFQAAHQPLVDQAVGLANAAVASGALTREQGDLVIKLITSSDNALALANAINKIPGSHNTVISTTAAAAMGDVTAFLSMLDHIPTSREVSIIVSTINGTSEGSGLPGISGRATGGTVRPGEITLVGERGPELAVLPAGTEIIPNGRTMSILRHGMAAGGVVGGGPGSALGVQVPLAAGDQVASRLGAAIDSGLAAGLTAGQAGVIQAAAAVAKSLVDALGAVLGGPDALKAAQDAADTIGKVATAIEGMGKALDALSSFDGGPSGNQIEQFSALTQQVVNAVAVAASLMDAKGLKAAADYADGAGKVLDLAAKGTAALTGLRDFRGPTLAEIQAFVDATEQATGLLANAASRMSALGVAAINAWADAAAKSLDLVAKGSAALQSLRTFRAPTLAEVQAFAQMTGDLVRALVAAAGVMDKQGLEAAGLWMSTAGAAMGVLQNGVVALEALRNFRAPTDAQIAAFAELTANLVRAIAAAAAQLDRDLLAGADRWQQVALGAVDLVGKGVAGLDGLRQFRAPTQANIDAFVATAALLIAGLAEAAKRIDEDGRANAAAFAGTAGAVLGIVGGGIEGFLKFKDFVAPSKDAIDKFVNAVHYLVLKMAEMAGTLSKEGMENATLFSTAATAALGATKAGTDAFRSMEKLAPPSATAIDNLVIAIQYVVKKMGDAAQAVGVDGLTNAKNFATAGEESAKSIGSAVDLIKKLGEPAVKDAMPKALADFKAQFDVAVTAVQNLATEAQTFRDQAQKYHDRVEEGVGLISSATAAGGSAASGGRVPSVPSLPSGPSAPQKLDTGATRAFAAGGVMDSTGLALVGERGPELAVGPGARAALAGGYGPGARVYAPQTTIQANYAQARSPIQIADDLRAQSERHALEAQTFFAGS